MANRFVLLATAALGIAACDRQAPAQRDAGGRSQATAQPSAAASRAAIAALGLTERQLLDAELVGADGRDLGDVERVARNSSGQVDRLLVEAEGSDPDRYVYVPVEGLTVLQRGSAADLSAGMTAQEFAAMPAVDMSAP